MRNKRITDVIQEAKQQAEKAADEFAAAADPALAAVKQELQAVEQQAAPAVAKAKDAVSADLQQVQAKAEPILQQAKKKAEPATRKARQAMEMAKPGLKAAKETAADAGRQIAHAFVPEVYVQLGEKQFTCTDIVERCREDYRATHKTGVHSCKVYIKPEDGMAYYVINQTPGKILL